MLSLNKLIKMKEKRSAFLFPFSNDAEWGRCAGIYEIERLTQTISQIIRYARFMS